MRPVHITDTTLRDAHQSLWATRMQTADMLPILGKMDEVGYWSLEVWGGATFDASLRFLDENPWERLQGHQALLSQDTAADAAPGSEPRGISPLLRRHRAPVRARLEAQRHRRVPHLRCAQRHPQRPGLSRGGQGVRRALRGRDQLHGEPRPHAGQLPRVRPGAQGAWRRHHLHQGHGRACSRRSAPRRWSARSRSRSDSRSTSTATTSAAWLR